MLKIIPFVLLLLMLPDDFKDDFVLFFVVALVFIGILASVAYSINA